MFRIVLLLITWKISTIAPAGLRGNGSAADRRIYAESDVNSAFKTSAGIPSIFSTLSLSSTQEVFDSIYPVAGSANLAQSSVGSVVNVEPNYTPHFPDISTTINTITNQDICSLIEQDDFESVTKYFENENKLFYSNVRGQTPLICAARARNVRILRYLIDVGASINDSDERGYSALSIAAAEGDREMVEALLSAGANPLQVTRNSETVYELSVKSGRKIVSLMIAEAIVVTGMDVNDAELVHHFISEGAYVNLQNGSGLTPLIYFSMNNDLDAVKYLLETHPTVLLDASDHLGNTALHYATLHDQVEIVQLLVQAGSNPQIRNEQGVTALDIALLHGRGDIIGIIRTLGR